MARGCAHRSDDTQNYHKSRKLCTDVFWLCFFIAFWIVLMTIASFSIITGNHLAIIHGYDSFGNICGIKHNRRFDNFSLSGTDTSTKPYVLVFYRFRPKEGIKICVEECPSSYCYSPLDIYSLSKIIKSQLCRYDFDMKNLRRRAMSEFDFTDKLGPCPSTVLAITQRCIPFDARKSNDPVFAEISCGGGITQLSFVYIYLGRYYIGALCGLAFVISVFLSVMFRWLTKYFGWLICIFALLANASLCTVLWHGYRNIPAFNPRDYDHIPVQLMEEYILNKQLVYFFAIFSSVSLGVLSFVIFFSRKSILTTSILFAEVLSCLTKLPSLVTTPFVSVVVLAAYLCAWSFVMICTTTATYPAVFQFNDIETSRRYGIFNDEYRSFEKIEYIQNESIRKCFWVLVAGFLWTTEFLSACDQFSFGVVVARWYFERPLRSPIVSAARILLQHHLGTIAKGSLLITPLRIPRLIVIYLHAKMKAGCKTCMFLKKLFDFMDRYLGTLNTNAYTVAGMTTIDLSPAGRIARKTMASAQELENVNRAAYLVLFLGKVFVATVTSLFGLFLLQRKEDFYLYMAPLLLSTIFAFLIAHVVFLLFETTMDTLVLCVCEDKRLNGCSGRWVQSKLSKFLGLSRNYKSPFQIIQVASVNEPNRMPFKPTAVCSPTSWSCNF